ncbi:MAG: type I glyceraldehyde-3-phosphate dehydrogenase [Candidatus Yanofskybacteria bacterium RIFCSPLOWO2_02_FULL_47_9b]|uniref:Type I glyceraldehyde-3-phosphate dehydrogenase n=1 Tax=Candidatus Yanofskybacteria bacterium RIFCSPLOWO2_02_FULL_47_9b TaxID=1802708 RepID=A0A1F8H957_9BACT|nr:MAG: type I glyceraldehyde-3-phosphate dehydrogenase [Candidatus Yanofskybacteria bacterium RIFCSPLOWO2_02_FULL_47_9b]
MRKLKIAINGFGRIGRAFYKLSYGREDMEVVAVNDLGDPANLLYLLKYDSAYGIWLASPKPGEGGPDINFLQIKDLAGLPWRDMGIDVVIESTGFYTKYEDAKGHIDAGAKRVVITAPAHGEHNHGEHELGATVLMGINEEKLETCQISSNASCTTNASSPVIQVLHEALGIEKAVLSTTHAYTASQRIVDSPNAKDFREGRAAAVNIVPSSTGAAIAVTKVIPELEGKFDGIAMRVPVVTGSIADITMLTKRNTTKEEVNSILREAAKTDRWKDILEVCDEPIVSSDIRGSAHPAIVDSEMTRVVDGNLVKVLSWYDNEMGYTNTLIQHVSKLTKYL